MFKRSILAVAAVALLPLAANAAPIVTSAPGNTVAAGAGTVIDFDSAIPSTFAVTTSGSYAIQSGSNATGAAPLGDATKYLTVTTGGSYQLLGSVAFNAVSLYWGSIDAFNTLDLLGANGSVIGTVTGNMVPPANGDQSADATNRRVTISGVGSIYGIKASSSGNAFELDDVKFQAAVPEPASWAMMVGGFGLLGGALRRRRDVLSAVSAM